MNKLTTVSATEGSTKIKNTAELAGKPASASSSPAQSSRSRGLSASSHSQNITERKCEQDNTKGELEASKHNLSKRQKVGEGIFGVDIDSLQIEDDEIQFLHKLRNLVLNLKGCSTGSTRGSGFSIGWEVENNVAFVSSILGGLGNGREKYEINFDANGYSYFIEGVEKSCQLAKLNELLEEVSVDSKKSLKDSEGFNLNIPKFQHVLDHDVNVMIDRIWSALWEKNGGSIPGLKIKYIVLMSYEEDEHELTMIELKGEWDDTKFKIEFGDWVFELTLLDKSRVYGFSNLSEYGHYRVPGGFFLTPGDSYYHENYHRNDRGWLMDSKHKSEFNKFMNSLLDEIEK